ncbi:hypothetical protein M0813_10144 [Anaeramoeba flamelloides]|uniref:DDE-1 domain-containing protein n=1 Tax=Anaeramoeba flamelloides TaxID=1746091 RepID=A0ABQ8X464_9EUKA|nr:hypothetical protein M0813_10144 [Anaeramoeba flamelloides]
MSAVCTISAYGNCLKTLYLLPRKSLNKNVFEKTNLNNYAYATSPRGFITKDLFYEWVRCVFIPEVEAIREFNKLPKDEWTLLVLDGHNSRANLTAIHLLQKHYIDCVVIPSHSSHILQPLDVGIFKYFKDELRRKQRKKKKKNFFLLVDHCLNYATSTMHCVDAFEDAGIYPLKLLKINNDVPIFPAEVKEFSFSNFNYGSRIKMSGQVITSSEFIEHMINQDKRKKEAQKKSSKKHKPPSHLFKQLFLNMNNTFYHKEFNFDDNNIIHITKSSSIEQLNKRLINDEKNHKFAQEKQNKKKTNESQLKENQENANLHSTENNSSISSSFTLQPRFSKQSINSNSQRHKLYGTESPIEPTIQNPTKKSNEKEFITPLSPGRTSITTEKNYIRTDQQQFLTPKRTQDHINRINEINRRLSNGSKTRFPSGNRLQSQTQNRTPFRSIQNKNSSKRLGRPINLSDFEESPSKIFRKNSHPPLGDQDGRYSLVKNKLYHRNTITPTPVQRILYPSNRLTTPNKIIEHHQNTDLNQRDNVRTEYFQPINPDFNDLVLVQEQRFTRDTSKENKRLRTNKEKDSSYRRERSQGRERSNRRYRERSNNHSRNSSRVSNRNNSRGRNYHKGSNRSNNKGSGSTYNRGYGRSSGRREIPYRPYNRPDSPYHERSHKQTYQRQTPKQNRLRKISNRTQKTLQQLIQNENDLENY